MKLFTTLMMTTIIFVTNAQDPAPEASEIPTTRKVLHEAATLWMDAYTHMKKMNYIGTEASYETSQIYFYSKENLNMLRALKPDSPNLSFRFYLGDDSLPHFGLVNDYSASMIIVDADNVSKIVDTSDYSSKVVDWLSYLDTNNPTMAYVRSYTMLWTSIDTIMGDENTYLRVDPVVHTLSPYDPNYQVSDPTIEGFLAFDLLVRGAMSNTVESIYSSMVPAPSTTEYYDFAMPCPKNCPEK